MKFGVVVFPGSNCDMDMEKYVLDKIMNQNVVSFGIKIQTYKIVTLLFYPVVSHLEIT